MKLGIYVFTFSFYLLSLKPAFVDAKVIGIQFMDDGKLLSLVKPTIVKATVTTDSVQEPDLRWVYYSNATGIINDLYTTSEFDGPSSRDGSYVFTAMKTLAFREDPRFVGNAFRVGLHSGNITTMPRWFSNTTVEFPAPWTLKVSLGQYITLTCRGGQLPDIVVFVGRYDNNSETKISISTDTCSPVDHTAVKVSCNNNNNNSSFIISVNMDKLPRNNSLWRCRNAKSIYEGSRFHKVKLERPHDGVQIIGYKNGQLQHADGSTLSVHCLIKGGHPSPNVTFGCNNGITGENYQNVTHVGSVLGLQMDMHLHGINCTCHAHQHLNEFASREELHFNIVYAPDVKVNTRDVNGRERNVRIRCSLKANPNVKDIRWEQRVGNTVVRNSSTLQKFLSPNKTDIILPFVTASDSGVYWCMANNGIQTENNSLWSSGSATLTVRAPPLFLPTTTCFTGSLGQFLQIEIPFFCEFCETKSMINLLKGNIEIQTSSEYTLSLRNRPVTLRMYGALVERMGFSFLLEVNKMKMEDIGQYRLTIGADEILQSSVVFTMEEETRTFPRYVVFAIIGAWVLSLLLVIPIWHVLKKVKCRVVAERPPQTTEDRYDNEGYFILPDSNVVPRRTIPVTELSERTYIELVSHTTHDVETQTDI